MLGEGIVGWELIVVDVELRLEVGRDIEGLWVVVMMVLCSYGWELMFFFELGLVDYRLWLGKVI